MRYIYIYIHAIYIYIYTYILRACNNKFARPVNSARPDIYLTISLVYIHIYVCVYVRVCACACARVYYFFKIFRKTTGCQSVLEFKIFSCFQRENENEKVKKRKKK